MAFIHRIPVRFADVDYARVLYYPRFFDYCHRTFEDFFHSEGLPYDALIQGQNLGFPTVHAEADFRSPLRFGETARIELSVTKVGVRSVHCRYRFYAGESATLAAEIRIVSACISISGFTGVDTPASLRALFERHLERT